MKPQDEFAVIVAGVVSASTFQLLDAAGNVVMELGATTIGILTASAFDFRHLDPLYIDSQLAWTQAPGLALGEALQITGPAAVGGSTPPQVSLVAGTGGLPNTQGAALYSGVRSPAGGFATLRLASVTPTGATADLVSTGHVTLGPADQGGLTARLRLGSTANPPRNGYLPGETVLATGAGAVAVTLAGVVVPGLTTAAIPLREGDVVLLSAAVDQQNAAGGTLSLSIRQNGVVLWSVVLFGAAGPRFPAVLPPRPFTVPVGFPGNYTFDVFATANPNLSYNINAFGWLTADVRMAR